MTREKPIIKHCRGCGNEFKIRMYIVKKCERLYCTKQCSNKFFRRRNKIIEKKCKICHKIFYVKRSSRNINLYCSKNCCYKDPEHLKKILHLHNEKSKKKMSVSAKNKFAKGFKSPWWTGADRPLFLRIRTSVEYIAWRNAVLDAGLHICKACGHGDEISVHHIKPFSRIIKEYNIKTFDDALICKELWDVDNGVVLCYACHNVWDKRFHTKPSKQRLMYYNHIFN